MNRSSDNVCNTLCVCMTPLHVLMAEAINRSLGGEPFRSTLYLTARDDEKSRYYFRRLGAISEQSRLIVHPLDGNYGFFKYADIWLRRRWFVSQLRGLGPFDRVILPASLSHFAYAVPSTISHEVLETYDDGIVNIIPGGDLLTKDRGFAFKVFLTLSGIRFWPERIMRRSRRHYSIYRAPNAFQKVEYIPFSGVDSGSTGVVESSSVTRILFGPPPEAKSDVLDRFARLVDLYRFDGVLCHPRWPDFQVGDVPVIKTNLISEDYLAEGVRGGGRFEVYGYDTTALINAVNIAGVDCYTFLPAVPRYDSIRQLMIQVGVKTLDI